MISRDQSDRIMALWQHVDDCIARAATLIAEGDHAQSKEWLWTAFAASRTISVLSEIALLESDDGA